MTISCFLLTEKMGKKQGHILSQFLLIYLAYLSFFGGQQKCMFIFSLILINIMPRLSTYSNYDYPQGEEQIMPWEFWTDEERSLVIKEGYKDLVLTSAEVKPYLNASRLHFYTQWLVPILAAGVCYGPLRVSLLAKAYRKHPTIGFRNSSIIFGGFTLLWLNLSPFYVSKESEQIRALKTMWGKIGSNVKTYNDLLSTSTTSTSLDKETWEIYAARTSGCADEDQAPYLLPNTPATTKIKRIFL